MRLYRLFATKRPPEMCQPESPFYLAINCKRTIRSHRFKRSPLGIHKINGMMKALAGAGGLSGRKSNHCARKTMVTKLCQNDTPDSTVMQLTGHKSVQSLNHYKVPSLRQQEALSHVLSDCACAGSSPATSASVAGSSRAPLVPIQLCEQPARQQASTLKLTNSCSSAYQGLFTGATFNSCTIRVNLRFSGIETNRKRPRVLLSDSDSD